MNKLIAIWFGIGLICSVGLVGCGQKGPLVLPDQAQSKDVKHGPF